jgi:hypothetical protein
MKVFNSRDKVYKDWKDVRDKYKSYSYFIRKELSDVEEDYDKLKDHKEESDSDEKKEKVKNALINLFKSGRVLDKSGSGSRSGSGKEKSGSNKEKKGPINKSLMKKVKKKESL